MRRFTTTDSFSCKISGAGLHRFAQLRDFLDSKGFVKKYKDQDVWVNDIGIRLSIRSINAGDRWISMFNDGVNKPVPYMELRALNKRIESHTEFNRIR